MLDLTKLRDSLVVGKADEVRDMVKRALDEGQDVEKVLNEGLIAGMNVVGEGRSSREMSSMFLRCSSLPGL